MDQHNKISFFKTPRIWIKDKIDTGINNFGIYAWGFLPSVFIIIGLIADGITILKFKDSTVNTLTLTFLFLYGLINLFLLIVLQRNNIRLNRTRKFFEKLHTHIISGFRCYIDDWDKTNGQIPIEKKINYVTDLLSSFNDNFLKDMHRKNTVITLKYLLADNLHPIRVGYKIEDRINDPEGMKDSYVYKALTEGSCTLRYIYVKDLDNPDNCELQVLGQYLTNIKARATGKYTTFIAVPMRSEALKTVSTSKVEVKKELGLLGFDLKEKYGFGNLEQFELNIIYIVADLLSIIVGDIIKDHENGKQ